MYKFVDNCVISVYNSIAEGELYETKGFNKET